MAHDSAAETGLDPASAPNSAGYKPTVLDESQAQDPEYIEHGETAQDGVLLVHSVSAPDIVLRAATIPKSGVMHQNVDLESVYNTSDSSHCPEVTLSQDESTLPVNFPATPPSLRGLWRDDEPARETSDKFVQALDADSNAFSAGTCSTGLGGRLDPAHLSAIRGGDPPEIPRRKSNTQYESSERSEITDLGRRGRQIATKEGTLKSITSIPPGEDEIRKPLADRLLEILVQTPGHGAKKGFFPEMALAKLLNMQSIRQELESCFHDMVDADTIDKYAAEICEAKPNFEDREITQPLSFKKIFAILVLSEKTKAILLFLKDKISDLDLPLAKTPMPGKSPNLFTLVRKGPKAPTLACFGSWKPLEIRKFEEWQWTTLAPFFHRPERKNVGQFLLPDHIPLPFTADSRYDCEDADEAFARLEFEGGFSTVFKVEIHPEQHDFHDAHVTGRCFAIKCLISRNRAEFKKEADTLMKFSGDAHPHLVSLLATYEQFRKFYLIFHWAEADLKEYWKVHNRSPTFDYETVLWVAEQCHGIADGLSKIHRYESSSYENQQQQKSAQLLKPARRNSNLGISVGKVVEGRSSKVNPVSQLYGRHGDIKPENILWFRDPNNKNDRGVLKITDFGLTEFSVNHSRSHMPKSKVIAATPSYRPPEFDLHGGLIGRSYDIWTLGCLYLELIAWLLGGWKLVERFNLERVARDPFWFDVNTDTFFEIVRCAKTEKVLAMVKPAVTKFIYTLHSHPKASEFIHDFLNLIEMDMLIVKPTNTDEKGRITCEQLDQKLFHLLDNCKQKMDYAVTPAPWTKDKERLITVEAIEAEMTKLATERLRHKELRVHNGPTTLRKAASEPSAMMLPSGSLLVEMTLAQVQDHSGQ